MTGLLCEQIFGVDAHCGGSKPQRASQKVAPGFPATLVAMRLFFAGVVHVDSLWGSARLSTVGTILMQPACETA
jgi:hypothetical protein